jgi:hypothetical protein
MKVKLFLFFLFFIKYTSFYSQEFIDISFHQDTKLLFTGDKIGNHAGTINMLVKAEIPFMKFSNSYLVIFPVFEYANLHSASLKRYSAGIGYIQQNVFLNKLNFGINANYGFIERLKNTTGSWGLSFELFYKISKRFSLSYLHQIVHRTDLEAIYNVETEIRNSSFLGIKVHF